MPTFEILITFFLATVVFAYIPGPAMIYTSTQTVLKGRRAGWMAVLGIHMGGYVHVVAASVGLAALFTIVPVLYMVMKYLGAGYLCWLGLKLIFSRDKPAENVEVIIEKSSRRVFWDSAVVEILNPKTAIFFLAFLPQFTQASAALPIWAQFMILGTIVNIMFSSGDVLCVILADRVSRWAKGSSKANNIIQYIGGGLLIALGVNLMRQE